MIRAVWPEADPDATEQAMRDLLGRFGLMGDQVYQRVGRLSRRREEPGGAGAAGGAGRQRAGAGRADEPPRPVGLRRAGAGAAGVRGHGASWSATTAISSTAWSICCWCWTATGASQVIHGNYDTYELMRAQQEAARPEAAKKKETRRQRRAGSVSDRRRRRRRRSGSGKFPYRKTAEIEADIAAAETELRELEERLASPDLYRDGDKVKQTTQGVRGGQGEAGATVRALGRGGGDEFLIRSLGTGALVFLIVDLVTIYRRGPHGIHAVVWDEIAGQE